MSGLNIEKRDNSIINSGKKCRHKGKVPGVFYGKEIGNFMFEVSELELNREVSNIGEHGVLNFSLDNEEKKALIKEVQRDPVTHKIIHIDLGEIKTQGEIETEVPIQYIGEKRLVGKGVVLQKEKDSVKISCKVDNVPKNIKIDISKGISGSVYRYSDLEVGNEISIIENIDSVIASISNEKKTVSQINELDVVNYSDK